MFQLPRPVLIFLLGAFLSNIGTWMQIIAQGWLVAELSDEPFWSGFVSFCAGVPLLIFSFLGGALADRHDRRQVLFAAQVILMCNAILMALLTYYRVIEIWGVACLAFIAGTAAAINNPTYNGFLFNIVGKNALSRAVALNGAQFQLSRMIGPGLAGIAIGIVGTWGCFALNAASFLAVIPLIAVVPVIVQQDIAAARRKAILASLTEAVEYTRQLPQIHLPLLITTLSSFFLMAHIFLLPLYVKEDLGYGANVLGSLWVASAAGSLLSTLILERRARRFGNPTSRDLKRGTFFSAVCVLAFANVSYLPLMYVCIFFCGAAVSYISTGCQLLIQSEVAPAYQGRILGLWGMLFQGSFPLGNLAIGTLAQWTSLPTAWSAAAILLMFCLWFAPFKEGPVSKPIL